MLQLPIGWQENYECVEIFCRARKAMCETMAKDLCTNGARNFKNARGADPNHYLYLDKLLNSAQMKIDMPWGKPQHRLFHQLGGLLVEQGCAEKNAQFKGVYKITDEKDAREWLKATVEEEENRFKLVMRYAHH